MEDEKKEVLNKISREETLKIKLAETLRETTKLAGEFRMNSEIFEDEILIEILKKGSEALRSFNKELSGYLSNKE